MNKPNEKSRGRPWLILALIIFGMPLVLCAGLLTWYSARQSIAANKLHMRIEDLSQRGEPIDDESMQLWYEVSTSDTNTERWVELGKILDSDEFRESSRDMPFHQAYDDSGNLIIVPPPGDAWPNRKPVEDFLQKWIAEIETIHKLGEAEYVNTAKPLRRPIKFQSIATLLPDTQHVRAMARLLQLELAVALHDGDRERVYQCLRACRGLERSTYGEPIIISQLVGQAVGRLAAEMLQKSIEHDQLTDQQMDELAGQLPTFPELCELYDLAMRGERAMILPIFSDPERLGEIMSLNSAGSTMLTKTRAADALYYLEVMDQWLDAPRDDMGAFRDAVGKAASKLNNDARNAGMLEKMDHAMSYMMIPAIGAFSEVLVQRAEHNNLIKLAMAVRKFHRKYDRWPKSLDELSNIGVDASQLKATNWQFGYRIEKNGDAVLWGIYPTTTPTLPAEPPKTEGRPEDEPNAPWVWRLKP